MKKLDIKRTKIISTIGPSSLDKIKDIIKHSDILRINFSHGDKKQHRIYIEKIRDVSEDIPILIDLPGPKIRVGKLENNIYLKKGDKVIFSKKEGIIVNDDIFYENIKKNSIVLISDGKIKIKIINIDKDKVEGIVIDGGLVSSGKGINIPGLDIDKALTEKDKKLLKEALKYNIDFIGLSFVISENDIIEARDIIKDNAFIVSKIENKKVLSNLDKIIKESDGVMIARGDLGIEIGLENLPFIEKRIVKISRFYGKPVILATQVLESMVENPTPTRSEVIDIANSIYLGVDAILLSDETAIGKYPIESVRILKELISKIENKIKQQKIKPNTGDDAIAVASVDIAKISKSKLIIAFSRSGKTIERVSRLRPKVPIIGITNNKKIARKLKLYFGVNPIYKEGFFGNINDMIKYAEEIAKEYVNNGNIVIVGGDPLLSEGRTDFVKLHYLK